MTALHNGSLIGEMTLGQLTDLINHLIQHDHLSRGNVAPVTIKLPDPLDDAINDAISAVGWGDHHENIDD